MARGGGLAWKGLSLILRLIELLCAVTLLVIFSYYLAKLHDHKLHIATYIRAVEGISGAAILYTLIALLLVCFIGGITFFSFIALLLDIAFAGAFIYVAYVNRGGAGSCNGYVNTAFGSGETSTSRSTGDIFNGLPSLKTACRTETASFAVAIISILFFLLSALIELALMRHHKKEKALGHQEHTSSTTAAPKRKFWQRKPKGQAAVSEKPDALPAHQTPADFRTSHATESTAVGEGHQTTTTTTGGEYTPYRSDNAV